MKAGVSTKDIEIRYVEIKIIGLTTLAGVNKSENENVFICGAKKWAVLSSSEKGAVPVFKSVFRHCVLNDARKRRTRSNDKLEAITDVFEMWNQFLQNGFVTGSCMAASGQLVAFTGPFQGYIFPKPRKYGIKIWVRIKFLLVFLVKLSHCAFFSVQYFQS